MGAGPHDTMAYDRKRYQADALMLVFDVTKASSFETVKRQMLRNMLKYCPDMLGECGISAVLVGTKCDLEGREVLLADAQKLAQHNGTCKLSYFETVSLNGDDSINNVAQAFQKVTRDALLRKGIHPKLDHGEEKEEKQSCCCWGTRGESVSTSPTGPPAPPIVFLPSQYLADGLVRTATNTTSVLNRTLSGSTLSDQGPRELEAAESKRRCVLSTEDPYHKGVFYCDAESCDFSDLSELGSGVKVDGAHNRAISLEQLERIKQHVKNRLESPRNGECEVADCLHILNLRIVFLSLHN